MFFSSAATNIEAIRNGIAPVSLYSPVVSSGVF